MLYYDSSKSITAVSFDTACFNDLNYCIKQEHPELTLYAINPEEFVNAPPDNTTQYINLVIRDLNLRQQVSEYLDQHNLDRFTFVHPLSTVWTDIGSQNGSYIGPFVNIQTKVVLENDLFIHGLTGIGHKCSIGTGTIVCGHTLIGGTTKIGRHCLLNTRSTIYDAVSIVNNTIIGAESTVRKSITDPGVYATLKNGILKKINATKTVDN
jgi:UDP-3-O-[3-hydroxymyristoyl] glucosamine N-acyltransferase